MVKGSCVYYYISCNSWFYVRVFFEIIIMVLQLHYLFSTILIIHSFIHHDILSTSGCQRFRCVEWTAHWTSESCTDAAAGHWVRVWVEMHFTSITHPAQRVGAQTHRRRMFDSVGICTNETVQCAREWVRVQAATDPQWQDGPLGQPVHSARLQRSLFARPVTISTSLRW